MNSNQVVIHINTPAVPRQEYLSVKSWNWDVPYSLKCIILKVLTFQPGETYQIDFEIFMMSQDPVYLKRKCFEKPECIEIMGNWLVALGMFVSNELKWERFTSFGHSFCIFSENIEILQ